MVHWVSFLTVMITTYGLVCSLHEQRYQDNIDNTKEGNIGGMTKRVFGIRTNCQPTSKTVMRCKKYRFKKDIIDYCRYFLVSECTSLDRWMDGQQRRPLYVNGWKKIFDIFRLRSLVKTRKGSSSSD